MKCGEKTSLFINFFMSYTIVSGEVLEDIVKQIKILTAILISDLQLKYGTAFDTKFTKNLDKIL